LTELEQCHRLFACLCTLKQSYSKFHKEQKLFNDLELEMSRTCPKLFPKAVFKTVLALGNMLSLKCSFSFHVPQFRAL